MDNRIRTTAHLIPGLRLVRRCFRQKGLQVSGLNAGSDSSRRYCVQILGDALAARGAQVDVLAVYETVIEPLSPEQLAAVAAADYVTFTSASTATNLAAAAGGSIPSGPRRVSIGPVTSAALRELGAPADVEGEQADIDGLLAALVADAAAG